MAQPRIQFFMLMSRGRLEATDRAPGAAIESACRLHLGNHLIRIFVLEGARVNISTGYMADLRSRGCNITVESFQPRTFFDDTPLGSYVADNLGALEGSRYWYSHMTDFFRLAVLWKLGGWYLDFDVIVMRPLWALRNIVALQGSHNLVNNAISHFDRGHPAIALALQRMPAHYNSNIWDSALAIASWTFQAWPLRGCARSECLLVAPPRVFFPISYGKHALPLFQSRAQVDAADLAARLHGAYAIHYWNKDSHAFDAAPDSAIAEAYRAHCLVCKAFRVQHKQQQPQQQQQQGGPLRQE